MKRKLVTIAAFAAATWAYQGAMAMGIEQNAPAPAASAAASAGSTANDRPASVDEDKPQPSPRFSASLRNNAGTGTVVVMVQVGADDKAKSFHVMMSSGSKALDDEAVRTVKGWSYKSAIKNGVPAGGYVQVPITFRQ